MIATCTACGREFTTSETALGLCPECAMTPRSGPSLARWAVQVSPTDERTMTLRELVDSWRSGLVTGEVLCRRAGTVDWIALRDIPEVRLRMTSTPPPPLALDEPAPPAHATDEGPALDVSAGSGAQAKAGRE